MSPESPYDEHDELDEEPLDADLRRFGEDGGDTATVTCPHCQREIYEDTEWCPYCDRWITRPAGAGSTSRRRAKWLLVIFLLPTSIALYRLLFG